MAAAHRGRIEPGIHKFAAGPLPQCKNGGVEVIGPNPESLSELSHLSRHQLGPHRDLTRRVETEHESVGRNRHAKHSGSFIHRVEVLGQQLDSRGVEAHDPIALRLGWFLNDDSAGVVDRGVGRFTDFGGASGRVWALRILRHNLGDRLNPCVRERPRVWPSVKDRLGQRVALTGTPHIRKHPRGQRPQPALGPMRINDRTVTADHRTTNRYQLRCRCRLVRQVEQSASVGEHQRVDPVGFVPPC